MEKENNNNEISDLRRLQLTELDMLKIFANICDKYGLRYFLLGGTLLGAVRHGGFIPWDDDIDVCMPRNDYSRFLDVAEGELSDPYYLDSMEKNSDYRYCFARIANRNIKIMNYSANIPREEDSWIDIIPMDGMPDGGMKLKLHKFRMVMWRGLNQVAQYDELVDQKRRRGKFETLLVRVGGWKIWRPFVDYHKCMAHIKKELVKYDYDSCDTVINFMAAYGFDETFRREWFGDACDLKFEDRYFKSPADHHHVLEKIYGDYMTMPPESERNKHNAEIIKI